MLRPTYQRLLRAFSHRSRAKKFDRLLELVEPRPTDRVLDVGASGEVFLRYTFEDVWPHPERIVAGGHDLGEMRATRAHYPQPVYAVFDGCALPFPDQSFDLVFSNAVIEHVLGDDRQRAFAREIMRVGRSWFVTTPNFWFPFETHYHLPGIQFLPREGRRAYNRLFGTRVPRGEVQELGLLDARAMRRLFPSGRVEGVRVTFWPETLIAYAIHPDRAIARR